MVFRCFFRSLILPIKVLIFIERNARLQLNSCNATATLYVQCFRLSQMYLKRVVKIAKPQFDDGNQIIDVKFDIGINKLFVFY